jgi:hypothetical protein
MTPNFLGTSIFFRNPNLGTTSNHLYLGTQIILEKNER